MVELTYQQALKYRAAMQDGAQSLTDEEALTAPMLYERWQEGKEYEAGQRLYHAEKLWRVLIGHVSQDAWRPDITPSLFAEVLIPDPDVIPEWVQPESTNPYMKGDKVRHVGKVWVSDIDYNVFEPGVAGWSEVEA